MSTTSDPSVPISRRRRLRLRRLLTVAVGLVLLAVVAFWTGWYFWTRHEFLEQVAYYRQAGWPVWFHELAPRPVPRDQDARELVLESEAVIQRARSAQPSEDLDFGHPERISLDQYRQLAQSWGEARPLIRLATALPHCQFEYDYQTDDPLRVLLPHIQEFRNLARLLVAETRVALAEGRHDEALADTADTFRLAHLLREEPFLVCDLVALAIDRLGLDSLSALLAHDSLSDAELAQLDEILRQRQELPGLADVLRNEAPLVLSSLERSNWSDFVVLSASRPHSSLVLRMCRPPLSEMFNAIWATPLFTPWRRQEQAQLLRKGRLMYEAVAESLPEDEMLARLEAIESRQNMQLFAWYSNGPIVLSHRRHSLRLAHARLALRVDRHHDRQGMLPAKLDEVLDATSPALDGDVFGKQPKVYERSESRFAIYSAGDPRELPPSAAAAVATASKPKLAELSTRFEVDYAAPLVAPAEESTDESDSSETIPESAETRPIATQPSASDSSAP